MNTFWNSYCNDHIFKQMYKYNNLKYTKSFFIELNKALNNIKSVDLSVYKDFINHKLKAKRKKSFDFHMLISSLCELAVMNTFIIQSDKKDTFLYEPQLRSDNKKNIEFSIKLGSIKYNIEVKSPNFETYNKKLNQKLIDTGFVTSAQARLLPKDALEKLNIVPAPDSKVKDFLVDSNLKFPTNTNKDKEINILFISWNENYDQACTALKHPASGLLTKNSWYKDTNNNPITFPNIDLIFISDLYKNIIVHMLAGNDKISKYISGVPYFENESFTPFTTSLTPFLLPFSRFALVNTNPSIKQTYIDPLPITFPYNPVDLVTEKFVSKLCPEFISTFKTF